MSTLMDNFKALVKKITYDKTEIDTELGNKAESTHSHDIGDVTSLQTSLNGKAPSSHTHSGYASSNHTHSGYASSSHTHTIANVTNLQSSLDGKSSTNHTHSGYASSSHSHPVDSGLSSSSTNPVQNKAVYSAIGDIKSALNSILGS